MTKEISKTETEDRLVNARKAFNTEIDEVVKEIILAGTSALPKSLQNENGSKLIYQAVKDGKPQDAIEARLLAKEAILYSNAMEYMGRAERALLSEEVGDKLWYPDLMKHAQALLRIHNEVVQTLAKHRAKGEQKMIVQHQHINVEEGGKAMVGNVNAGEGKKRWKEANTKHGYYTKEAESERKMMKETIKNWKDELRSF